MHSSQWVKGSLTIALLSAFSSPLSAQNRPYESTGHKITVIPIVNFSSDDGAGYGARTNIFDYDGHSVPYRHTYSVQAFFTTKGKWVHRLQVDAPHLLPKYRIEAELAYEKEESANYFGNLPDELIDTYAEDQQTFRQAQPTLRLMAIRDLQKPWGLRGELQLAHHDIKPNARDNSILRNLNPLGTDGGTLLQVRTALRYDTRDDYTNSTRGLLEEALLEYGIGAGGDFNGLRLGYQHRHFHPLASNLVLAHRASADLTLGDIPFFELLELGGSSTVRGLPAARVRGQGRFLLNGELRWQGVQLSRRQHIFLGGLLFADVGQIYARSDGPSLDDWRRGAGAGLRFHWHGTIMRADYGKSGGRTGIYITFRQLF